MEKPFDVSVEQLAHDLALLTVAKLALNDSNYGMPDYYKDYVNDYAIFKQLIESDIENPTLVPESPSYKK